MVKGKFHSMLSEKNVLILDGGFATTLEMMGHTLDKRLWSAYTTVISPLSVVNAHEKFIEAGSDIIISSSYQMSYEGFQEKGYRPDQTDDFLRRSTACALVATYNMSHLRPALVAASVGCYGAHLADGSEYRGDYGMTVPQLESWHRHKFDVLSRSGAAAIACETIPCLVECRALRNVIASQISDLKQSATTLEGWMSCSCKSGTSLNSGDTFEDALRVISDPPFELESDELSRWGVGVNCTDPQYVCELLDIVRDLGSHRRPVVVYPNKGEAWDAVERCWVRESGTGDEAFADMAQQWKNAGATLIGGCCRTTPSTIRQIFEIQTSEYAIQYELDCLEEEQLLVSIVQQYLISILRRSNAPVPGQNFEASNLSY